MNTLEISLIRCKKLNRFKLKYLTLFICRRKYASTSYLAYQVSLDGGSCYVISTRNDCYEFLELDDVHLRDIYLSNVNCVLKPDGAIVSALRCHATGPGFGILGQGKDDSAFHPFSGSIKRVPSSLGN